MKLYKQRNGKTWSMRFVYDGRRIERTTGETNKRKAEAYAAAFLTQLRNEGVGILTKKQAPNFKKAIADFLKWSASRQAPKTTLRYSVASAALLRYFGDTRVDRITKPDIEKFVTLRKGQFGAPRGVKPKTGKAKQTVKTKVSDSTVNRELACLKKMFSNLVDDGVLSSNAVKLVKFFKEDNESGRVLNTDEERFYLIASSQPLQDYATILVETGLRPDELCRLAVNDVFTNVAEPYLMIRKGKTKAATRSVPLSERAAAVLANRITKAKGKYVFPGGRGGAEPDKPAVKFNNAHYGTMRRSKIDGVNRSGTDGTCTLYSFRHTFATRFLEATGDLLTLAALLGHSSLRMVTRYAHPSDKHKFEAIRRMDEKRSKAA